MAAPKEVRLYRTKDGYLRTTARASGAAPGTARYVLASEAEKREAELLDVIEGFYCSHEGDSVWLEARHKARANLVAAGRPK